MAGAVHYRVYELDPDTWQVVGELGSVLGISIEQKATDDVPLLESASVEFIGYPGWNGGWYRVDMVTDDSRTMLGCFLLSSDGMEVDHGDLVITANGYSVLKPASDEKLPDGSCVMAGSDGASYVASLLGSCPGGVESDGSFVVPSSIVHGSGCSKLRAAWEVLDACGRCLMIDGDGTVRIVELPDSPSSVMSRDGSNGMQPGISIDGDEVTFTRELSGDRLLDIVELSMPEYGLDGERMRIVSRSITLGAGATAKETVRKANGGRL